jgi:hypothetical protein
MSPRKPKIREHVSEVIKDYETQTLRQIGIRYGCSYETARRVLTKAGVKIRKRGQTPNGYVPRFNSQLPSTYTEGDVVSALLKGTEPLAISKFLKVKKNLIEKIGYRNGLVKMQGKWGRA